MTASAGRRVLLGLSPYAATGDALQRQARALEALQRLERAEPVNVQWRGDAFEVDGIRTLAVLERSSRTVTGRPGPLKPPVSEMVDPLVADADARGLDCICLVNADIVVTQAAVDRILDDGCEGYAFSRLDVDGPSGQGLGIQVHGVDAFAVTCGWWRANRWRFRDYILGESTWDNVYTAILLAHGRAQIENREGLIRHERHDSAWQQSPFAEYTRLLAARDAPYFSLWCRYVDRLATLRAAGGSPDEERALAREVFRWEPGPLARAVQAGRSLKSVVRYAWVSAMRG